jgi:predicted alpha/beta-fold hydrolase
MIIFDILRLIVIIIIILFFYFIKNNLKKDKGELVNLIYNENCVIKKFKKKINDNNLFYDIDNLLLKVNILNPLMNSFILNNFNIEISEYYNNKKESEVYTFNDGSITTIDYIYNKDKSKPFLYFTNTFGDGLSMYYSYRMMLELNKSYNCVFIYSKGYKSPINNNKIYLCNITEDLTEILNYVINKHKTEDHILIGLSMGSNSFCNYLCNNPNKKIKGFISICNPLDLLSICYTETHSTINNMFINKFFKKNMRKYLLKNFTDNIKIKNNIDYYLNDLDIFFDKFIKKYNKKQYKTFSEFCYNNSCINNINKLKTPSLFIFAEDDCVTPISKINIEKLKINNYIFQFHSRYGSHLGHYDDDGNIWSIKLIDLYIKYILKIK